MKTRDNNYIPDILETIANLSNDEVFTPPKLANDILDLLPKEIWKDSSIKFLDPACKTGIFLREIASRLIEGLADEFPNLQERVNHILTKQVYGIGITELTTLMARRTLYCSAQANSEFSICTEFTDEIGNIVYPDTKHTWNAKSGRCEFCGAGKEYDKGSLRENYAYPFIHDFNVKEIFGDMKFDVIIGNPPYQLNDGSEENNFSLSSALYHEFVDKAFSLRPRYVTMVIPSRWMTRSARGIPETWVDKMINDKRIKEVHDFMNSDNIFPSVGINGGVNYFLWDKDYTGKCSFYQHSEHNVKHKEMYLNTKKSNIVIRDLNSVSIIDKIEKKEKEGYIENSSLNFSGLVSPKNYFSEITQTSRILTSNWKDYSEEKTEDKFVKYYMNGNKFGWISPDQVPRNIEAIGLNKVYITSAHSSKTKIIGNPIYGEPNSVCSQSFLVIGYNQTLTKEECYNIISYINTKFFRFMVSLKKQTQNGARGVYQFVPLQDFSKPWKDKELYEKYELTEEEISYIEGNISIIEDDENSVDDFEEDVDDELDC